MSAPSLNLNWRKTGNHYVLHWGAEHQPVLRVVPDAQYPGVMWRIQFADGSTSDMANLSRAKDAARDLGLKAVLSRPQKHALDALEGPEATE